MIIDELGEYDENAIPEGISFPITYDEREIAQTIGGPEGTVAKVGFDRQMVEVLKAKRRGIFLCRVLNGEIRIVKDDQTGEYRVHVPKEPTPAEKETAVVEKRKPGRPKGS